MKSFAIVSDMELNEYQKKAEKTALYPNKGNNLQYVTLGLVGEAGEIANATKKIDRDNNGVLTDEMRKRIKKELGDVLWYVAGVAWELGYSLEDIAQMNLDKLAARKRLGTLHGDGDDRE